MTEPAFNIFMNYAPEEIRTAWVREYTDLYHDLRAHNATLIAFHRSKLGRARIEYGIRRYHTWERALWVVYVNREYGTKFEIKEAPRSWKSLENNPEKFVQIAIRAWVDYRTALGLPSKLAEFLVDEANGLAGGPVRLDPTDAG